MRNSTNSEAVVVLSLTLQRTVLYILIINLPVMPRPTERKEVLATLRQPLKDGKILVGAGAGEFKTRNINVYHIC